MLTAITALLHAPQAPQAPQAPRQHHTHLASDGRWHVVYKVPGTTLLSSVLECPSRPIAQAEADRLNGKTAIDRATADELWAQLHRGVAA